MKTARRAGCSSWSDPPEDYQTYLVDQYCIDDGTSKALVKALALPEAKARPIAMGTSWNIELRPAHREQLGRADRQVHA